MGQFSWFTMDTHRRIVNGEEHTVYLVDDKGNKWKEERYEGYGVFGGKDFYELLAEMNGYSHKDHEDGSGVISCPDGRKVGTDRVTDDIRHIGIELAFGIDGDFNSKYPEGNNPNINGLHLQKVENISSASQKQILSRDLRKYGKKAERMKKMTGVLTTRRMIMSNENSFAYNCREFAQMRNVEVLPWEEQGGRLFRQSINQNWIDDFGIMNQVISLNKWLKDHGKMPLSFKVVTQEWWDVKDGKPFELCKRNRIISIETPYLASLNGEINEHTLLILVKGLLQTLKEVCA